MWTTIGTVGAVVVALAIALTQAGVAIVLSILQRRQARRKVGSLVSAWVEHEYAPSSSGEYYQRTVFLHLASESDEPVFRVELLCGIQTEKGPIQLGPLSAPPVIPVLPAKREFTYDIAMGLLGFGDFAHDSFRGLVARVAFRDRKDKLWQRGFDGKLEKVRKPNPAIITEASDDLAFATAGPLDNLYNPRAAVFAFADVAANEDVSDLEFGQPLSTQAPGWAKSPLALIKEFRTMLCELNVATHVWYPTPRIAYVRMFTEQAGGKIPQEMDIITLVWRGGLGWTLFGVGPYLPWMIPFSPGELDSNPLDGREQP